jgi:hypothetical protein
MKMKEAGFKFLALLGVLGTVGLGYADPTVVPPVIPPTVINESAAVTRGKMNTVYSQLDKAHKDIRDVHAAQAGFASTNDMEALEAQLGTLGGGGTSWSNGISGIVVPDIPLANTGEIPRFRVLTAYGDVVFAANFDQGTEENAVTGETPNEFQTSPTAFQRSYPASTVPGEFGLAAYLPYAKGTGVYYKYRDAWELSDATSFSISLWARTTEHTGETGLMQLYANSGKKILSIDLVNLSGKMRFNTTIATTAYYEHSIARDTWFHYLMQYRADTGNIQCFVNGILVYTFVVDEAFSFTDTAYVKTSNVLVIGADTGDNSPVCTIDEVLVKRGVVASVPFSLPTGTLGAGAPPSRIESSGYTVEDFVLATETSKFATVTALSTVEDKFDWDTELSGFVIPETPITKHNQLTRINVPSTYGTAVFLENFEGDTFSNRVTGDAPDVSAGTFTTGKFGRGLNVQSNRSPYYRYRSTWGVINETTDFRISCWYKASQHASPSSFGMPIIQLLDNAGKIVCAVRTRDADDGFAQFNSTVAPASAYASYGYDVWNHHEISYQAATGQFRYAVNGIIRYTAIRTTTFTFVDKAYSLTSNLLQIAAPGGSVMYSTIDEVALFVGPGEYHDNTFTVPTEGLGVNAPPPRLEGSGYTVDDFMLASTAAGFATIGELTAVEATVEARTDPRPTTYTPLFAPFSMLLGYTISNNVAIPEYAVDIELKASLNNFTAQQMVYWYDSRGGENANWLSHEHGDVSALLEYTFAEGIGISNPTLDVRSHLIKGLVNLDDSLATLSSGYPIREVLIYPSNETNSGPSPWMHPTNAHNIVWSYALVDDTGIEATVNGKTIWRPTHVLGWEANSPRF